MRIIGEFRILGALCALGGLLLLAENYGLVGDVHLLWPVLPAFLGVGLILLFRQRRRSDLLLLGLGIYLVGAAGLFLLLNFTSWQALAWAWPVFIALLGLSSISAGALSGSAKQVLVTSGVFLLLLAAVFFLVFGWSARLWPISLTLFGLWVLFVPWARNWQRRSAPARSGDDEEQSQA